MKRTIHVALAIQLAAFYFSFTGVCQTLRAQESPEVRFRLVQNCIMVVSVQADRSGPFEFVFDTGADTTVVDAAIAPQLSLAPLGGVEDSTIGGTRLLNRGLLTSLTLGSARVENLPVLVQDLSGVRRLDPHIQGIVGQNFLARFNYLIDYRARIIRIEQGIEIRDSVDGERVEMRRLADRTLVAVEAESRSRSGSAGLHLLLDSGASSLVLLSGPARALDLTSQLTAAALTSGGEARLQVGRLRTLRAGAVQFREVTVALPSTDPVANIGDGLLPTAIFQAVYVDNEDGFVVFNPRQRKN